MIAEVSNVKMATQSSREQDVAGSSGRLSTITPLTIAMVHEMNSSGTTKTLNNHPISTISLVCHVEDYQGSDVSNYEAVFRDDTGSIRGRAFRSQGSAIKAITEYHWVPHGYAHVIGTLNEQAGNKYIVINFMKNADSYKEISMHKAQVLWALLIRNNVLKVPVVEHSQVSMEIGKSDEFSGLTNEQKMIARVIKDNARAGPVQKNLIYKFVRLIPVRIDQELATLVELGFLVADSDFETFSVL